MNATRHHRVRGPRRRLITGGAVAALLLTASPAQAAPPTHPPAADTPAVDASAAESRGQAARWAERQLRTMSLEQKVGQLFNTYVYGESADTTDPEDVARNQKWLGVDNGREAVEKYHLGGVIYFAWSDNLAQPAQVAGLSNGLQKAALGERKSGVPLLVSTDQEHGDISRLSTPATRLPGAMALGATHRPADARKAARVSGSELRAVGINQNYAPVADVNVNPANPVIGTRSFSSDPRLTGTLATAQVRGFQSGREGVVATAKHFPGHGDTDVDSHTALPVIHHTLQEWRKLDAPPFRQAIRAGVDSIMSAHIQFPELDPTGDPATLSEPIMTGLLREELGYDGVVVTDSLAMEGVRETYPDEEVPVRALKAGVDVLLMPPDLPGAHRAVVEAVKSGELTQKRIDTSVRRILKLKHERGVVQQPFVDPDRVDRRVGTPANLRAAQRLSDRTTTLIRNEDGLLPLDGGARERVLVTGWGEAATEQFADRLTEHGAGAAHHWPGDDPTADAVAATVREAKGHETVVVLTNGTGKAPGQARLVRELEAAGAAVVTVAVGTPYDIAHYPDAGTHLATYSRSPVAVESAVRVLLGESAPRGRLPVTVPSAQDPQKPMFRFGHGLRYRR
ncbi:glycoside hydrolase family 3 protein [Streptomyces sp. XM4193]|uniref:glycoside hydrolase family 3 protein n=1 Tax=Streptomyces sp. XM4193 TaxID=2929782 RepID=UPI001FF7529C|nr:glycoside hydrolase family 3 protein [Streptomyces sp. XM4193]MCK1798013.1 glycoside hydrolase family 3 protein [Streptomyces sp. XM4193]